MTPEETADVPETVDESIVYLTIYAGRFPEDGTTIGGAYWDAEEAETVAEEQSDSGRDREYYSSHVKELDVE